MVDPRRPNNTLLTADIIARAAAVILENKLSVARRVFRGYEEDFAQQVNGYEVGSSITIRRPAVFHCAQG